ncbi:MAG: hypothetical protein ACR2GN_06190 [Bacteroidia bacterium]
MIKTFLSAVGVLLFSLPALAQHTLVLKTGESMKGEVISVTDSRLTFKFKGNNMNFNTNEVSVIYFEENMKPNSAGAGSGNSSVNTSGNSGSNSGFSYKVTGRKLIKEPVVSNLTQDHGRVVVDITVDKYGNVIKAEPGAPGTTTTSKYLLTKAKQAAESVKFDTSPTMPLETTGTVTIDL